LSVLIIGNDGRARAKKGHGKWVSEGIRARTTSALYTARGAMVER
jgi:hypothetical protein